MGSFEDFSKVSYHNNSPNSNHAKVKYPLAFEYKLRPIISILNDYIVYYQQTVQIFLRQSNNFW